MPDIADRLSVSRTVILDGTGKGSITIGPERWPEFWHITRMTTQGAANPEPVLNISRGGQMVDTTKRSNGAVSETDIHLRSGETITVSYSAGQNGAQMVFYVEGEMSRGLPV